MTSHSVKTEYFFCQNKIGDKTLALTLEVVHVLSLLIINYLTRPILVPIKTGVPLFKFWSISI
ncbi:hypothetical protein GCM10008967_33980 [Bacillus carboniphilus]|uniref:Uncharacterized protein n=1 Tax=Bacillus carboniphilus TaxID=86663 RepID=A0ABN0WL06_9BACI